MPVSKPTKVPRWATSGGALNTEPSEGKKDVGWVVEEPPADTMNWLQKLTYDWVLWLQDITNQALTWTANHVFSGNITVAGTATLAALAATNLALSGTLSVAGTATLGAVAGNPAFSGNVSVAGTATVTGLLSANGHIAMGGTNPSTANAKELHSGLTCRGWARLSFDATNAPTIAGGRNAHATVAGGGGSWVLDFEHDLGTDLCVQVTDWNTTGSNLGNKILVTGVSVVSGRTRVSAQTINAAGSAAAPPSGGNTGCYIEIKSAN